MPTTRGCASPLVPARPLARMAIEASATTRRTGRHMLPKGDGVILHVSGCAKGCARPAPAAATLTATAAGYDLSLLAEPATSRRGAAFRAPRSRSSSTARAQHVSWRGANVKASYTYEKDAAAIYRRSFAIIRGEADLARFSPVEERVAVRVIHACGMVETARDLVFSPGAAEAGREALRAGAPIFCDASMVAEGVTRADSLRTTKWFARSPIPPRRNLR